MRLKELLRLINMLGMLILLALFAGCDDSSPVPTKSTPPLVLSLSSPARLADFDADTFLVSDYKSNAIHFTDKDTLEITKSIRVGGQPTGIAHYRGLLYVGNKSTGSVDVLNTDGDFQYYLGDGKGIYQNVLDVAIDENAGLIYVLDSLVPAIKVYDLNGDSAGPDLGISILKKPSAITVSQTGDIFVSDFGDPGIAGVHSGDTLEVYPSIWVLDNSGNLLDKLDGATYVPGGGGMFGGGGTYTPFFSTPQGLWVNSKKQVFIADALSGGIQVYDLDSSSGTYKSQLTVLGSLGTNEGELHYPLDVLVDKSTDDVFVADNRNGRILVFVGGGAIQ